MKSSSENVPIGFLNRRRKPLCRRFSRSIILPGKPCECEYVRDIQIKFGRRYYLIKWKDFPESENTWELVTNLKGIAQDLLIFEEERKADVQRVETQWNRLYQQKKVKRPLYPGQLDTIIYYASLLQRDMGKDAIQHLKAQDKTVKQQQTLKLINNDKKKISSSKKLYRKRQQKPSVKVEQSLQCKIQQKSLEQNSPVDYQKYMMDSFSDMESIEDLFLQPYNDTQFAPHQQDKPFSLSQPPPHMAQTSFNYTQSITFKDKLVFITWNPQNIINNLLSQSQIIQLQDVQLFAYANLWGSKICAILASEELKFACYELLRLYFEPRLLKCPSSDQNNPYD